VDLSVIIPTRGRAATLGACVERLSAQTLGFDRFEVLIGIDGEESGETRAVGAAAHGHLRSVIREFPRVGLAAVRNGLLEHARGRIVLSMNDDVLCEPGMLEAHVRAHERAHESARGRVVTVVGDSPWVRREPDRLWDRLVRETSLFFFYDQMPGAADCVAGDRHEPGKDWGFRHAFGLNVSYPAAAVKSVGGYAVLPVKYGYEDVEIAWRLREQTGAPVLFEPAARGRHDHRYEPGDYLEREYKLGYAAWGFAQMCPGCAGELFGRDIRSEQEVAYARLFVANERTAAERARAWFVRLAEMPAGAVSGPHERAIVQMVYQQHLGLKRWLWRHGLLDAAERREMRLPS
jgi:glycosyltransferase involved in cell wall biosynthesis